MPKRKPGPVPQTGLDMDEVRAVIEASTDVAFLAALAREAERSIAQLNKAIRRMNVVQCRAERRIGQLLAPNRQPDR